MKPIALLVALLIFTWAFVKTPANAQPNSAPVETGEPKAPIETQPPIEKVPMESGAIVAPGSVKEEVRESKRQVKKSRQEQAKKNH